MFWMNSISVSVLLELLKLRLPIQIWLVTPEFLAMNLNTLPHNAPLASGGVRMFIDETLNYKVIEMASNEAFQALWIEVFFVKKKM